MNTTRSSTNHDQGSTRCASDQACCRTTRTWTTPVPTSASSSIVHVLLMRCGRHGYRLAIQLPRRAVSISRTTPSTVETLRSSRRSTPSSLLPRATAVVRNEDERGMPVTPWQGWSAHQEEVDDTRVLAGLL